MQTTETGAVIEEYDRIIIIQRRQLGQYYLPKSGKPSKKLTFELHLENEYMFV